MAERKRIFIIGHSGAGKGVLAQALAKELGWKFISTDFALESSIGRNMEEIISEQGAEAFQNCLSEILAYQMTKNNIVVTTDESIIFSEKNRKLLASEFTIYLQVSLNIQLERISYNRPLLPVENYANFLEKRHHLHDRLYKEASVFSLSSDDGEIDTHVQQIVNALKFKD
ncbi:hypothetical protein B1207_11475 [Legionella quinlivanii]|uniref:Shikimate kinase n=1 Tax=Legionella quinlivanii TaxID=45073 RepID=A0A364LHI3_9GAMM|nr:shikimate kinase [Legionella quinlivanii]RAP35701.1 hypothetical protein B1207_11475 [Legionella quinlivanii]